MFLLKNDVFYVKIKFSLYDNGCYLKDLSNKWFIMYGFGSYLYIWYFEDCLFVLGKFRCY